MTITCPGCAFSAEVPDEKIPAEGVKGTCPKCQTKFTVKREVKQAPILPSTNQNETKACPLCGEEILVTAKKCKHCSSMLDGTDTIKPQAIPSQEIASHKKTGIVMIALIAFAGLGAASTLVGGQPIQALAILLSFGIPILLFKYDKLGKFKVAKSIGIGIVIFGVMAIFAGNDREERVAAVTDKTVDNIAKVSETAKPKQEEPIVIDVADLVLAYKDNTVAADQKYKGKTFGVVGTIRDINTDLRGNPYIVMSGGGNQFQDPHFKFDKSASASLANLKKGDIVALICVGMGDVAKTPMSGSCILR